MAWWQRQKGKHIYVYYRQGGRIWSLPRRETEHLDRASDLVVEKWVADWQSERQTVFSQNHELTGQVDRYCRFLEFRGRARKTIWEHRHSLYEFALPYFLDGENPATDPNLWAPRSLRLWESMRQQGVSENGCRKIATALKGFYDFLIEEGIVYHGIPLPIRIPIRKIQPTPLKFTIRPADVLDFIVNCKDESIALMAAVGFFFSLRTFEIMALRPCDFRAGRSVQALECGKIMNRYKLFDRLAVEISRQRNGDGTFTNPKSNSFGFVACFNAEAASWIVDKLNAMPRDQLLFRHLPDSNISRWRKYGLPGLTLKDLRRASLYYLGHYMEMDLIPLKNHARHRFATTTELYLRRPIEQITGKEILDLEA